MSHGQHMEVGVDRIEATMATTHVKKYLMYFGSDKLSPEVISSALKKSTSENPAEVCFIHTQIYLFINDPSIKQLLDKYAKQLQPFTPFNTISGGITVEFYLHLLFLLDMHEDFLQMIVASSCCDFSKKLISEAIPVLIQAFDDNKIQHKIMQTYLVTLAQLCDRNEEHSYTESFNKLIIYYMGHSEPNIVPKREKIIALLRIIGLVYMDNEDTAEETEIAELVKLSGFVPTSCIRTGKTYHLFTMLYGRDRDNGETIKVRDRTLDILTTLCTEEYFVISDTERSEWLENKTKSNGKDSLGFIGGWAHVSTLILTKYIHKYESNRSLEILKNFTAFWSQFKPSTRYEDFEGNIPSFEEFCKLVLVHGYHPRYQKKWFQEFLKYPTSCDTVGGLRIVEDIIAPNADLEIGIALIQKLKETLAYHGEFNERIKTAILDIASNESISGCTDQLVEQVYAGGAHSEFARYTFEAELNILLTKMGALEIDPKSKRLGGTQVTNMAKERTEYRNAAFRLFFENPLESTIKMVPLAIRTQKFQALHHLKVFLSLKLATSEIPKYHALPASLNLLEFSLFKLLLSTNEMDSLFEIFANNLPLLITENLLIFDRTYQIVQCAVDAAFFGNDNGKWLKLLRVYTNLFIYLLERNPTSQMAVEKTFINYARRYILVTSFATTSINHQTMIEAREKFYEILAMAKKAGLYTDLVTEYTTEDFKGMDLEEFGLFYIRNSNARKCLLGHLNLNSSKSPLLNLNCNTMRQPIINWINNSCRAEWDDLVDFTQQLLQLTKLNGTIHSVINDAIFACTGQGSVPLTHYLSFYSHFLRSQQTKNITKYMNLSDEHKTVVKTYVSILRRIYKPNEVLTKRDRLSNSNEYRSAIMQQSLLSLLEFVEWIILHNPNFEKIQQSCLKLVTLAEMVVKTGGCDASVPIYSTILSKLTHGNDDISTFERNISSINISSGSTNGVQVKMSKNSIGNAEILENYNTFYSKDETEFADQLEQTQIELIENKNLYPFQFQVKEPTALLNVEFKFE